MAQSISQQFGRALVFLLEKEGRGAQTRLAREKGIDRGYLNAIIQGRKTGSENVRSKIADHFQMPYEEMLVLGRRLLEESGKLIDREILKNEEMPPGSEEMPRDDGPVWITSTIQKAIVILESDSEYRHVLAGMIDSIHRVFLTGKENAEMRLKIEELEQRLIHLEKLLENKSPERK